MFKTTAIRNGSEGPEPDHALEPGALEALRSEQEQEVGDFILRHVLEKDAVFFEG